MTESSKFKRAIKATRALLAVIIGCLILIPFLFVIAIILVIIGFFERTIIGSSHSTRIAKYLGDDGAELLKTISGSK